jgi:RNA polymerase sigma-70 factor (family 1)
LDEIRHITNREFFNILKISTFYYKLNLRIFEVYSADYFQLLHQEMSIHLSYSSTPEKKFVLLYHDHYVSFCFFASRYVHDSAVAEDIVADVAMRLWEKKVELENDGVFKSYFYNSIRNACLNWLKREKLKKKKMYAIVGESTENDTVVEHMIEAELFQQIERALQSLPPQCNKVLFKLFVEGKSLAETAVEMRLSLSTIKNQRQRGIKLLRERLSNITLVLLTTSLLFCAFQ